MSGEFKLGDRVRHKTGGPHMIITDLESDHVWCRWMDKSGHAQTNSFIPEELEHVEKPKPGLGAVAVGGVIR